MVFLLPTRADDSMKTLSVTCQKYQISITLDGDLQQFTMFSKYRELNYGVVRPECFKGLSHVEQALFTPIHLAMTARKLKQGMRCLKGNVVFVDHT